MPGLPDAAQHAAEADGGASAKAAAAGAAPSAQRLRCAVLACITWQRVGSRGCRVAREKPALFEA